MASDPPVEKDPIVSGSMSWALAIAMAALLASTGWIFYDEAYGRRPWKAYQSRFVKVYRNYLETFEQAQAKREKEVRASEEFQAMQKALAEAEQASAGRIAEINRQLNRAINPRTAGLTETTQVVQSEVAALTYSIEAASSAEEKDALKRRLEEVKKGPFVVLLPDGEGVRAETFDYHGLVTEYDRLKARKARLLREQASLARPAAEIRARRDQFLKRQLDGLTPKIVAGLRRKMEGFEYGIKQIHIPGMNVVDRCETCHLAIREPVPLTREDMAGEPAFTSHPKRKLLEIHDPERFGCTPCHGGNGAATASVDKAHGRYHHWLWPLHEPENTEAGCLQCHEGALQLEHADTLNEGKELFRHLGCWACHPREGFGAERTRLQEVAAEMRSVAYRRADYRKAVEDAELVIDDADSSDEEVLAALTRQETLTLKQSELDTEQQQLSLRRRSLYMERKDVAPNLKDIRAKLKPAWIPAWLREPRKFRPTTRMPRFHLPEDHLRAIAAFVWQAGLEPRLTPQPPGDAKKGKALFDERGCLGCHSVGKTDEGNRYGGSFSTDLSRIGEKVDYRYLVRWIHNPRERTLPFCATCGRDITEKDYEAAGLPFRFDIDHSRCPVCDSEMQVQNQTVMPSFRLPEAEARDIAGYLMTLKDPDAVYPPSDYIKDAKLGERGKTLVAHYGCMGCHEIAGMETVGKIGTDLTKEGSKPIERLDFGWLTQDAKRQGWYDHKGFFVRKLAEPGVFDRGKEKKPLEKLRMPDFGLSDEQIDALTTFLLGSVDWQFPPRYYHNPVGFARHIAEGWWVLKKYNCVGCHQIVPGRRPPIQDLPQYAEDKRAAAPPSLVGEGARVDPVWLVSFLRNPALSPTQLERNGLRPYLAARMPTFTFSEGEISKLVRFFNAMSSQPSPYLKPPAERLTQAELAMARDAFVASECLKCHAGGEPPTFTEETTAPSFVLAKDRLKPRWMARWMVDPARLMPGTQMPTGLFERKGDRWIMSGDVPEGMTDYEGDHVDLFVRYMQQFTEEERRALAEKEKK